MYAVLEVKTILTCNRNVKTGKNENLYARTSTKIVSVHQNAADARRVADLNPKSEEYGFTFPLSTAKDEGMEHIESMRRTEVEYECLELIPGAEMYIETNG